MAGRKNNVFISIFMLLFCMVAILGTMPVKAQTADDKCPYRQFTGSSNMLFSFYAGTADGCYEMLDYADGTTDILYTNYATKTKTYLVENTYNNKEQEGHGLIPSTLGGNRLAVYNNYIYVIQLGKPSLVEAYGEAGRGRIYQLNRDGVNTLTMELADNERFVMAGTMVAEGNYLYCMVQRYSKGSDASILNAAWSYYLARFDLRTGEKTVAEDIEGESTWYEFSEKQKSYILLGGYSEGLVMRMSAGMIEDQYGRPDYLPFNNFVLYNIETGEFKDWFTLETGKESFYTAQDGLYVYNAEKNNIVKYSYATGKGEVFLENVYPTDAARDNFGFVADIFDNQLFIISSNFETGQNRYFAINLASRQITEIDNFRGDGRFMGIVAESDDYFLITVRDKYYIWHNTAPGGVTVDRLKTSTIECALILKEDYYAGNLKLIPIEDKVFDVFAQN